jgi:multisubunit Na+/H+ antiporter MnhG subunit
MLVMTGLAFYDGVDLNTAKLLLIVVLVAVANPAAAHALGRAAVLNRETPWLRRDRENG